MIRLLFFPDPPESAGDNNPPAPAPGGPAARAVLDGGKTERELQLEKDLADEKTSHGKTAEEKKQRDVKIAELEGEISKLREPAKPKTKKVRVFGLKFD